MRGPLPYVKFGMVLMSSQIGGLGDERAKAAPNEAISGVRTSGGIGNAALLLGKQRGL
jgi:hypothetical protein